ncbi:helix-turn-helix domain-containing protein [Bradymonadales bacterium TMQ1]|nr:helix-turn-helix domain-containing protein [Bradymonadales bacterium TMQ1]
MRAHLSDQQWRRVAELWREIHALSSVSLERAWEHVNMRLVELVDGVSMAGYAQRRSADGEAVEPVFFSSAGYDMERRLQILRAWQEAEPDVEGCPVNRQMVPAGSRCLAVPHSACVTPQQWEHSASKRLADALGIADAITVIMPAYQSAELFLCIDRKRGGRPFDYGDAALLVAAVEGVRPLMMRYLRSLGMLPGQQALTREERQLVRLLAGERDEDAIAQELGASLETLAAQSAQVYRKLAVANRYALIRLWFGVGESPISMELAALGAQEPAAVGLEREAYVAARVRRMLREAPGAPQLQLEEVARRLSMSERNLQRHLRQANTSFRALVDEVRQVRAHQMLASPQLEFTDIALRLGYEQVSSFNRAIKRWTGKTPGGVRSELLSAERPQDDAGGVAADSQ